MKKLLSLSILAATLASTVAFAAPGNMGGNPSVGGNAPAAAKDVLLVQKHNAAPNVLAIAAIAQNAINDSAPGNTVLKADFVLDKQQNLKTGVLVLANPLQPGDEEAIQAAVASSVRQANGSNGAGWMFVKFEAGQGNNIGTVYFIDSRQGNDAVKGIAVHAERSQVTFAPAPAKQEVVSELTDSKKKAALKATS